MDFIEHNGKKYGVLEFNKDVHGEIVLDPITHFPNLKGMPILEQMEYFKLDYDYVSPSRYNNDYYKSCFFYGIDLDYCDNYIDVKEIIMKEGVMVGITYSKLGGNPIPLLLFDPIFSHTASDNNGAGYKEEDVYLTLILKPSRKY